MKIFPQRKMQVQKVSLVYPTKYLRKKPTNPILFQKIESFRAYFVASLNMTQNL